MNPPVKVCAICAKELRESDPLMESPQLDSNGFGVVFWAHELCVAESDFPHEKPWPEDIHEGQ